MCAVFGLCVVTACAPSASRRAEELMRSGKSAEARGVLELQTKSDPKDWRSLVLLGKLHLLEERPDEAGAAFDKALPLNKKVAEQVGPAYAEAALTVFGRVNGEWAAAKKAMTEAFADWETRSAALPIQERLESQPILRETETSANKASKRFLEAAPVLLGYVEKARRYGSATPEETLTKLATVEARLKAVSENSSRAQITKSRMWTVAITLEAYSVDYKVYPKASSIEEVLRQVTPTYAAKSVSLTADGWGTPFEIESGGDNYMIVSAGADRVFDRQSWDRSGLSPNPGDDVVYRTGKFVKQWDWMGL